MSQFQDAIQSLQEGILLAVNKSLQDASYDKTMRGRISAVLPKNMYKIIINGITYNVKSTSVHALNDVVNVLIPQNNYNEMFIIPEGITLDSTLPANGGNSDTVNYHTVDSDVPVNAIFTDTVYVHPTTHSISEVSELQTALDSKSNNTHLHSELYEPKNNNIQSHISNVSNPHSVTKLQLGLDNAENKSSSTIRSEITSQNVTNALGYTPIDSSQKGSTNGLAELDSNGKISASQLPSYVDDVLEFDEFALFPIIGEDGKIYIDKAENKTYRWGGTIYVVIGNSVALGETSSTAYFGNKGKIAYDHSQIAHAPSNAQKNSDIAKVEIEDKLTGDISTHNHDGMYYTETETNNLLTNKVDKITGKVLSTNDFTTLEKDKLSAISTGANKVLVSTTNGNILIDGVETNVYTHPSGTNPHGTTKTDIGLGNVEDKSSSTIRSEIESQNVINALGYTPIDVSEKGNINGLAELDANGKVPSSQLPSYVDDVLEFDDFTLFPTIGESGKIYTDILENKTYRWGGTTYVAIGSSMALGETSSTAFRGDFGKTAYDHSQTSHIKVNLLGSEIGSATPKNADTLEGKDKTYFETLNSANQTTSFIEASTDVDIVTDEKHSTIFGKILKSIKTIRSNIGTLTSLLTSDKTSLVNAINCTQGQVNTINDNLAKYGRFAIRDNNVVLGTTQGIISMSRTLENTNNLFTVNADGSITIPAGTYQITANIHALIQASDSIYLSVSSAGGFASTLLVPQSGAYQAYQNLSCIVKSASATNIYVRGSSSTGTSYIFGYTTAGDTIITIQRIA